MRERGRDPLPYEPTPDRCGWCGGPDAASWICHTWLEVIAAWGFEDRTSLVWVHDQIGMGYHVRQRHELLLIGKRGELPVPAPADRPDSVLAAPRGRHSEQPEIVYALIERMYPHLARVELCARRRRPGWQRGATRSQPHDGPPRLCAGPRAIA